RERATAVSGPPGRPAPAKGPAPRACRRPAGPEERSRAVGIASGARAATRPARVPAPRPVASAGPRPAPATTPPAPGPPGRPARARGCAPRTLRRAAAAEERNPAAATAGGSRAADRCAAARRRRRAIARETRRGPATTAPGRPGPGAWEGPTPAPIPRTAGPAGTAA